MVVLCQVVKQGEAWQDRLGVGLPMSHVQFQIIGKFGPTDKKIVFGLVVGVERRSANVGSVDEVLHRDLVVAHLDDERFESFVESLLGTAHPPIWWSFFGHCFLLGFRTIA